MTDKRYLVLEDGECIEGVSFGYDKDSCGEVVFTTGMTGYPETLTDPSFTGQIVVFTYPLLGNYGVPSMSFIAPHLSSNAESERIWVQGMIVSSILETPSHYQMKKSLSHWLTEQKIPAIAHIDTRALTQKIREKGTMRGVISKHKRFFWEKNVIHQPVARVSIGKTLIHKPKGKPKARLVLIDCGVKHGILRALLQNNFEIIRVPWDYNPLDYPSEIQGVVCSNGPGDPKECTKTVENIRNVIEKKIPFLGICLGHQLAALALGADTYKLPYGHRGLNQPCQDVRTKKAYITSQNHGYAVDRSSIPNNVEEWFINLNDGTNEGLKSGDGLVWTTQFHPEGNPGPHDTDWIFSTFLS